MIEPTPVILAAFAFLSNPIGQPEGPGESKPRSPDAEAEDAEAEEKKEASPLLPVEPPTVEEELPPYWRNGSALTWRPKDTKGLHGPHRSGPFLALRGGFVTTRDSMSPDEDIEFDEGLLASLAFGHRFADPSRPLAFELEAEGVWTDQDADDVGAIQAVNDVTTLGPYVNGLLDVRVLDALSLYAGAGLGAVWVDVGTQSDAFNDFDDEDGPFFSWQAKAGARVWLNEWSSLDFGYRFRNIDNVMIDDSIGVNSFELETEQHVLEAGFTFGL